MQYVISRRRDRSKWIGIVLAAVLVLFTAGSAVAGAAVTKDQIYSLKAQAADLNQQKAGLQKDINKLSQSKHEAVQQKLLLEQKLNVLRSEIAVSEKTIANYRDQIAQKETELKQAEQKEALYFDKFCERVRSMEEDGDVTYWSVLFQSDSFADLLDRLTLVSEVMDYDHEIMDQLAQAREAVAGAKKDLEESKAGAEAVRQDLEAQKNELDAEQAEVVRLISQINSQTQVYAKQMQKIEASGNSIDHEIGKAERQYAAQIEAQKKAEAAARKAAAQKAQSPQGKGGYSWPLPGYTQISSPFGYRMCPFHGRELHGGADIPAPGGTPVLAAKSGVVVISQYHASYGNYVSLTHADGTRTLYAHMSSIAVSAGSTVSQGQVIGYVGSTGGSTGNHLHFETWTGNDSSTRVDPMQYF